MQQTYPAAGGRPDVEVKCVDGVTVAAFGPRLDASTAGETGSALDDLIRGAAAKLLCDFSLTEFISSAGLRLLLSTAKKLKDSGGELVLCSLSPFVHDELEMGGLVPFFTICGSEDEALALFGRKA